MRPLWCALVVVVAVWTALPPAASQTTFLSTELPLKVVSVLPIGTQLSSRSALTVLFSRPVIALGSDFGVDLTVDKTPFVLIDSATGVELQVAGKLRWATTYIARFDPDEDWPSDLHFELKINEGLRTWDDVAVLMPNAQYLYSTPLQSGWITTIDSAMALELTDGLWSAFTSNENPECPPDGIISIRFSYPVDVDLIRPAISISTGLTFSVESCGSNNITNCIQVRPNNAQPATLYTITIPSGTKYHSLAGVLQSNIAVKFNGLVDFKFPFNTQVQPSYRRHDLWLRHGLSSSVTLDQLATRIAIVVVDAETRTTLPFTLSRPDLGTLRIQADFVPSTDYRYEITADSALLDGFGRPLVAHNLPFTTQQGPSYFTQPEGYFIFDSFDGQWEVLSKRALGSFAYPESLSIIKLNASTIPTALAQQNNGQALGMASFDKVSSPNPPNSAQESPLTRLNLSLPISSANGHPSGFFAREHAYVSTSWSSYSSAFTSVSDLSIAAIQTSSRELLVWVSRYSDGSDVVGVTVAVYTSRGVFVATGTTGSDGTATILVPEQQPTSTSWWGGYYYDNYAVICSTADNLELAYLPNIYIPSVYTASNVATIVTDRLLYKLGDSIHIKAYVRSLSGSQWTVPFGNYELAVTWKYNDDGTVYETRVPVVLNSNGALNASIDIPADASNGDKTIMLWSLDESEEDSDVKDPSSSVPILQPMPVYPEPQSSDSGTVVSSLSIVVSDPRTPTASMTLSSTDRIYRPSSSGISLHAEVLTSTNLPIEGAEVAVNWRLSKSYTSYSDDQPTSFEGLVTLVSGEDGSVTKNFDLATELPRGAVAAAGDSLSFSALWVGPTGELIQSDVNMQVALSEWAIHVEPSYTDPLPGFPFAVYVSVRDFDGNQLNDVPVSIKLNNEAGVAASSCSATSDGGMTLQCWMTLNAAERFELVATASDDHQATISETTSIGQSSSQWAENPLTSFTNIYLKLDKSVYAIGDVAELSFYNPFAVGGSIFVHWGNTLASQTRRIACVTGANRISIPIGSECIGSCTVAAVLALPRQDEATLTLPVPLPISALFDFYTPRSVYGSLNIHVPDADREVKVGIQLNRTPLEIEEDSYRPGSEVSFTVSISEIDGGAALNGEVAIFVVDEAFIQLKPFPPADLAATFSIQLPAQLNSMSSHDYLASEAGYRTSVDTFVRRDGLDPWVVPSLPLNTNDFQYASEDDADCPTPSYYYSVADVDESDEVYFEQKTAKVTSFPSRVSPSHCTVSYPYYFANGEGIVAVAGGLVASASMAMASPAPAMVAESSSDSSSTTSSSGGGAGGSSAFPIRTQFETTPLFIGSLQVRGSKQVTFTLPDNVGTFSIRAYAVDSESRFGAAEELITVRRPLSLQPALPRITRVGDRYQCGVTVACSMLDCDADVVVKAEIVSNAYGSEGLVLETSSTTVHVTGTTPVLAKFEMKTELIGDATLQFSAQGDSELVDALQSDVLMLSVQPAVFVATSMAIAGSKSGQKWTEGVVFPPAVPHSGSLDLAASVGRYTAIEMFAKLLEREVTWPTGELWAARAFLLSAFGPYGSVGTEHQWVLDNWNTIISGLKTFTHSTYGLAYWNNWAYTTRANAELNAYGLFVASQTAPYRVIPTEITNIWKTALQNELIRSASEALTYQQHFAAWDLLAASRLVLGINWVPASTPEVQADLSQATLLEHYDDCSPTGKAFIVLMYRLTPSVDVLPDCIGLIEDEFFGSLRIQTRTAYVGDPSSGSAYSLQVQSLALAVLVRSEYSTNLLIEKLANYVSAGNAGSAGSYYAFGHRDAGFAAWSLSGYDVARGNIAPSLTLTVKSGNVGLLNGNWMAADDPPVYTSTRWDEITVDDDQSPSELAFYAKGEGEVSVAAGLSFVPASISRDPIYRGIYVEKIVRRLESNGDVVGPNLQVIETGALVEVTIQITSPDDLYNVVIDEWVPGGLEPLDPRLQTVGDSVGFTIDYSEVGGFLDRWFFWGWWQPFGTPTVNIDSVRWTGNWLSAGTHSVSYQAVAVTTGVFVLPPTHVYVVKQPELMGLSFGGSFLVSEEPIPLEEQEDYIYAMGSTPNGLADPRGCSTPCDSQSVCNLRSGECECVSAECLTSCVSGDCEGTNKGGLSLAVMTTVICGSGLVGAASLATICFCMRKRRQAAPQTGNDAKSPKGMEPVPTNEHANEATAETTTDSTNSAHGVEPTAV